MEKENKTPPQKDPSKNAFSTLSTSVKIIIALLVLVLLFLLFQLWRQYTYIQRVQTVRGQIYRQVQQLAVLRHRGPLTAADVSYIQAWMTFDYINTAFNLPSTYLMNDLRISNSQYPHISISHYARNSGLSSAALTMQVAEAVRKYVGSSTPAVSTTFATSTTPTTPTQPSKP